MKDAIVRKAGVYARVSKEDLERKKHSCSESIENQKIVPIFAHRFCVTKNKREKTKCQLSNN